MHDVSKTQPCNPNPADRAQSTVVLGVGALAILAFTFGVCIPSSRSVETRPTIETKSFEGSAVLDDSVVEFNLPHVNAVKPRGRISRDLERGSALWSSFFELRELFADSTPRLRTVMALNAVTVLSQFPWSMNVASFRWWAAAAAFTASDKGIIPLYSPPGDKRIHQLIFDSETNRHLPELWERAWKMKVPDPATPYRVHGGVI